MLARVVDQNPPHYLCGDAEEVRTALPRHTLRADQSHVRLVDERRRLQSVIAAFPPKIGAGAAPELAIDKRHQVVARLQIPASPGPKQPGHGSAVICLTHLTLRPSFGARTSPVSVDEAVYAALPHHVTGRTHAGRKACCQVWHAQGETAKGEVQT